MLKLISATFENYCQFVYQDMRFEPGVTFITGPCGSGKSNSFRGIRGTLTGDFHTRVMGGKNQELCYSAPKKSHAIVSTTWERYDGKKVIIRRNLTRTGNAELLLEGEDRIVGKENDITDKIAELTRLSTDVFKSCMFIEQGKVGDIFEITPTKIVDSLISLTDADAAKHLGAAIQQRLNRDSIAVEDFDESRLSLLQSEYYEAKEVYRKTRKQVEDAQSRVATDDKLDSVKEKLRKHNERINLSSQLRECKKTIEDLRVSIRDEDIKLAKAKQRVEDARSEKEAFDKQKHERELFDSRLKVYEDYQRYVSELKTENPVKPERPKLKGLLELIVIKGLEDAVQANLDIIKMHEDKVCITCNRPFEISDEQAEEAKQKLAALQKRLADHDKAERIEEEYEASLGDYEVALATAEQTRARAKERLRSFKRKPKKPKEVKAVTKDWRLRVSQELEDAAIEEREVAQNFARLQTDLKAQIMHQEQLRYQADGLNKLKPEIVERYKALIARQKELKSKVDERTMEMRRAAYTFLIKWRNMRAFYATRRRVSKTLPVIEDMKAAVEVCRKLPGVTIGAMTKAMTPGINSRLQAFGMDFSLDVNDDLSFTVTRGGHTFPHTRLSGGQKCVAGIAFWLTVGEITSIDAMFMDEPIDGFDPLAEAMLPEVFQTADSICRNQGKQLVIITHYQQLANVGNHIAIGNV